MRDFSWTYFSMTGDVNAYLLYTEINGNGLASDEPEEEPQEEPPLS